MHVNYEVWVSLFDSKTGGYDRTICRRTFKEKQDAEKYIAEIKRGSISSVVDHHGRKIDTDKIIDIFTMPNYSYT